MATENSYLNSLKAQKDGVIKLLGGITMHLYIYSLPYRFNVSSSQHELRTLGEKLLLIPLIISVKCNFGMFFVFFLVSCGPYVFFNLIEVLLAENDNVNHIHTLLSNKTTASLIKWCKTKEEKNHHK